MERIRRLVIGIIIMAIMTIACCSSAFASEHANHVPDYSRLGSVSVQILTSDGTQVPGGELTAYFVAQAEDHDGNAELVFTSEFAACGLDLSVISSEKPGAPELAKSLADYATSNGLTGTVVTIDNSGKGLFTNLKLGLYLIVQNKPAEGYNAINPFVITVPLWDGNEYLYDVDANPKPETATKITPPPDPPTPPDVPQTGQLWWPVPVLLAVGIGIFALGVVMRRRTTK
ncbi:MAG: hypothetical protein IKE43_03035 [Coriobacteriales bacterium]|nr:hypothetical protein [Coriobacteriales bacterium]